MLQLWIFVKSWQFCSSTRQVSSWRHRWLRLLVNLENVKVQRTRWDETLVQQNKGMNRCSTWYLKDNMWGFVEKCSCVKIWRRVLTLPVAMLSMRSLDSTTVLYSNSYYTVVASIFLVSAASCKAICKVTLVRTSDYSQPFWLKWHALLMSHVLIKYAHVLICISAGKGSRISFFIWN